MSMPKLDLDYCLPEPTYLQLVDDVQEEIATKEGELAEVAQQLYALPMDASEAECQRLLERVDEIETRLDELEHSLGLPTRETLRQVERVRTRSLGSGKAAELAGMPLARFLRLLGQQGVPVFDYDEEDLDEEFAPSAGGKRS